MTDYDKLVAALRSASVVSTAWGKLMAEAADAIGALLKDNIMLLELRGNKIPKRGEWIGVSPMVDTVQCSVCGGQLFSEELETPYCPYCGAKMFASDINVLNKNDTTDGPIITPCRGCSDYDGYGGCKSKGGCARAKMEVQE